MTSADQSTCPSNIMEYGHVFSFLFLRMNDLLTLVCLFAIYMRIYIHVVDTCHTHTETKMYTLHYFYIIYVYITYLISVQIHT